MMAAANINRDALTLTGGAFLRFGHPECWFHQADPGGVKRNHLRDPNHHQHVQALAMAERNRIRRSSPRSGQRFFCARGCWFIHYLGENHHG